MPKASEELTKARKEEIIDVCASLYQTMGFKDITIRDIGAKTSFTRTSIYNYFQTKEEIFLALLQREHEQWTVDLRAVLENNDKLSCGNFSKELAHTLEKRSCMLKLMSMNLYDMEGNSRLENLVAFKVVYAGTLQTVTACLEKFFPYMTEGDIQGFLYAFFPFLFGVYPYTSHTEKQKEAMKLARVDFVERSIFEITEGFVSNLLKGI